MNVDLPGLAPEGSERLGQRIAALGGPVVNRSDGEVADQLAAKRAHGGAETLERRR